MVFGHTQEAGFITMAVSTLRDVVEHYDACFSLGLGDRDQADPVEFFRRET